MDRNVILTNALNIPIDTPLLVAAKRRFRYLGSATIHYVGDLAENILQKIRGVIIGGDQPVEHYRTAGY